MTAQEEKRFDYLMTKENRTRQERDEYDRLCRQWDDEHSRTTRMPAWACPADLSHQQGVDQ